MPNPKINQNPRATEASNAPSPNQLPAQSTVTPSSGAAQGSKPIRYQNYLLVAILALLVGISVAIVQYKVPTIMTKITQLFAMSGEEASWLMSIFTLVGVFVALPASGLARRLGPKKPMLIAALFVALGSVVGILAQVGWVLILSRAIEGVALTIVTTTGPILIQRCVNPKKIGSAMGIWSLWGSLGSTLASVITPTLLEQLGFTGIWLLYAAITLAAAIVMMIVIRLPQIGQVARPALSDQGSAARSPKPTQTPQLRKRLHYRALVTPNIALFFAGFTVLQICLLAVLSFVPTRLIDQGFNATLAGFISTIPMLLAIISSPLFGVISDKTGRFKPLMLLSFLVMGPCTFLLYTNNGVGMWIAVFVMGLAGMGGIGVSMAALIDLLPGPEYVPMGMGVMLLVQSVGQFLGTALVQLLLGPDLTNWFFAGIVIMIIGIVGSLAFAAIKLR